jgi:hypothetical protein
MSYDDWPDDTMETRRAMVKKTIRPATYEELKELAKSGSPWPPIRGASASTSSSTRTSRQVPPRRSARRRGDRLLPRKRKRRVVPTRQRHGHHPAKGACKCSRKSWIACETSLLPAAAERAVGLHHGEQAVAAGVGELEFGTEKLRSASSTSR